VKNKPLFLEAGETFGKILDFDNSMKALLELFRRFLCNMR